MRPTIQLASGRYFNLVDMERNVVTINDIAWSLAHINRYTGHRGVYSVAQHSVLVSHAVPAQFALDGLLHDAAEFVLQDISAPLKGLLPDYRALSANIEEYLAGVLGIAWPHPPCIKTADLQVLAAEVRDVGNNPWTQMQEEHDLDDTWDLIRGVVPYPMDKIQSKDGATAYVSFLRRYNEIVIRESKTDA